MTELPLDPQAGRQASVEPRAADDVQSAPEAEQVERDQSSSIEYWYFCDGTSSLRW